MLYDLNTEAVALLVAVSSCSLWVQLAQVHCDLSCRGFPVLDVEGIDLPPSFLILWPRESSDFLLMCVFSETPLHPFVFIFSSGSSTTE